MKFMVKLQASKIVKAQGIGVHKPDEIIELGKEDLSTLSELIADKPFFFGDEPSLVSCSQFFKRKSLNTLSVLVGHRRVCVNSSNLFHLRWIKICVEGIHGRALCKFGRSCVANQGTLLSRLGWNHAILRIKSTSAEARVSYFSFEAVALNIYYF